MFLGVLGKNPVLLGMDEGRRPSGGQLMGQAYTKHITEIISYHLPNNTVRGQKSHSHFIGEETTPVEVTWLALSHRVLRS